MSRLQGCFSSLKNDNRCALIPYITAGDPEADVTVSLMHTLVESGADVIELGVPFSDPMADGPVIQAACERALANHTSLQDVLAMVKTFRECNQATPVILMGYLNPIERMGYVQFTQLAETSGVDGILTVDMPPEESDDFCDTLRQHNLDPIFLLSPTSSESRIRKIAAAGSGFLYYVSLKGVTGAECLEVATVTDRLTQIRQFSELPIGVGFGIQDAGSAASVAMVSDAVVVGSALIRILAAHQQDIPLASRKMADLLSDMRQAIDNVRTE